MSLTDNLIKKLSLLGSKITYNENNLIIVEDEERIKCYTELNNRIISITLDNLKSVVKTESSILIFGSLGQKDAIINSLFEVIAEFNHERILHIVKDKIIVLVGKNTGAYRICSINGELISCDTFRYVKITETFYGLACYLIKTTEEHLLGIIENDKLININNLQITSGYELYVGKTHVAIKDNLNTIRVYKILKSSNSNYNSNYNLNLKLVVKYGNIQLKTGHITPYFTVSDNFKNNIMSFEASKILV